MISPILSVEESEILKGFQALHNMVRASTAWFLILTAALSRVTSTETWWAPPLPRKVGEQYFELFSNYAATKE